MSAWLGKTRRALIRAAGAAIALLVATAVTPGAAADPIPNPQIVAKDYFGRKPSDKPLTLQVSRLEISVDVAGGSARTTILVGISNPTDRAVEGDFTLGLPAGSVITGYALDINGQLVDGVLVDRRKGERAYESRVRRGIDPGVAEITRENAFRTRIFPVQRGSGRTIRLEFVTPMDPGAAYRLPLNIADPVGAASVSVTGADGKGRLELPAGLDRSDDGGAAKGLAQGKAISGDLVIRPLVSDRVALSRHRSGETFFEINDDLPAGAMAAPKRVRIYWDRSRSRLDDQIAGEIEVVQGYLAAVKPETVDLVVFDHGAPQVTTLPPGEVAAALRAVRYVGATSLKRALAARLPRAGACLLFTDGRGTIDDVGLVRVDCPLFALSSSKVADHGLLTVLAARSSGEHLDLLNVDKPEAVRRLSRNALRVVGVTGAPAEEVDFAVLGASAGRLHIVGKAETAGELTVAFSDGETRRYPLTATAVSHDGAGALWAAFRTAELTAEGPTVQAQTLAMARRYSVASGSVVFLVLDNVQDYIDNDIEPPGAFGKDMLDRYGAMVKARAQGKQAARERRLEQVVDAWTEQKSWWATKFPSHPIIGKDDVQGWSTADAMAGAPPPPPPPPPALARPGPPPPPPPAPDGSSDDTHVEELAVTGSRVPEPSLTSVSPATAVTNAEIRLEGTTRVEDLLNNAPQTAARRERGGTSIEIKAAPWNPDRPYVKALANATGQGFWTIYAEQEAKSGDLPAFYLDVAELLFRRGDKANAIRVVLSALELPASGAATMTIVADRLLKYGDQPDAIWLYERILILEPDRPQPRRNLALALVTRARGETGEAQKEDYARALKLFGEVVMTPWDPAWDAAWPIALMEANRLLPEARRAGVPDPGIDPRLVALLDVDLRVVMEWNTDATDMDLWVDEPTGERAIYSNTDTAIGGRLSRDLTRGYGPEEYLLRKAPAGVYSVRANSFRLDQLNPNGAVVVRVHLFRNWGRPNEQEQVLDVELRPDDVDPSNKGEKAKLIGTVRVGPSGVR